MGLRSLRTGLALLLTALVLLPASKAFAVERAEAFLYVLENVDLGGIVVPLIVAQAKPGLAESGASSRPMKAFEALRARSPKAYGATSLRIDSGTRATLVLDKVADADQVLAEVFWTLASQGFTEIGAPPYVTGSVTAEKLSYGAQVQVLPLWDLLRFHESSNVLGESFVRVGGQLTGAVDAMHRLQRGDFALRKLLADAMSAPAMRPKVVILDAIADGGLREAFHFSADDALPALTDPSLQVRGAALDAMIAAGLSKSKPAIAGLEGIIEGDSDAELKLRAVKALSKAGVGKYNDLLESEKLKTGSAREALEAVEKLSKSSQVKIAAPALVGALSHSDGAVRDAAFKGLVALKQFDLLFQAMDGDQLSAKMREQIATVLIDNGTAAAKDKALLYLLQKGTPQGAILAVQTYGKLGSRTASPQLIEALKHDSPEVRQSAAEALALLKEERAISPLADAAAARARDREFMMTAAVTILGSLSLDQVKQLVTSKNLDVRQMAIRALAGFAKGSRPRPDVVSILQEARKDSDLQIRRSAVFALARLQDDGIARDLSEMRKDPDAEIRLQVATAIIAASPKFTDAGKLLDEMVKDTDKKVRIEAIGGLAKRKELASVPALKNLTQQPDPEVRRAVFAALLQLRTPENAADLRPVFQKGMSIQDSQVRLSCVQALADKTAAGEDLEALRQAAFDQSKEVKLAAIAVLQASKLPEAMDALANLFGDPDMEVREKALEALASIPAGELKKQKSRYLQDFIETPDMPEKLKKRAAELQKTV